MNFQKLAGITSDGIYGQQTAGAFANLTPPTPVNTVVTNPAVTPIATPITAPASQSNPYGMQFNYDASKDTGLAAASRLANSRIAEEMAARGIGGSTIEQERIAQSLAGLTLNFRDQAYQQFAGDRNAAIQQYEIDYARQRQIKEDAWTTAQERGYFNNEEARLWGIAPGTKTASERARQAQIAQANADRAAQERIAQAKLNAEKEKLAVEVPKATLEAYQSQFNINPTIAINNIYDAYTAGRITPQQAGNILNSLSNVQYYTDEWGNKQLSKTVSDPWTLWRNLESSKAP
jgi:hypothetical protein